MDRSGTLEGFEARPPGVAAALRPAARRPNRPGGARDEQSASAPGGPGVRRSPFAVVVAGTFLFGWLLGVAIVFKLWHLAHAPRWLVVSGVGYVTLMLPPTITGFALAWCTGRLAARGWSPASLLLAGAGAAGLVAGLLAI